MTKTQLDAVRMDAPEPWDWPVYDMLAHIDEQQREITRLREALKKVGARIENLGYDDYTDIQSIISAAIQEAGDE